VVKRQSIHDGLLFEEIEWSMPCGSATQAVGLKPADAKVPLPGILALHDHGGKKYFGWRKIVDFSRSERIRCANYVGFMSTWRDFLLNKSYTHTWMTYAPLLPCKKALSTGSSDG
jgi:hypothetical protein